MTKEQIIKGLSKLYPESEVSYLTSIDKYAVHTEVNFRVPGDDGGWYYETETESLDFYTKREAVMAIEKEEDNE